MNQTLTNYSDEEAVIKEIDYFQKDIYKLRDKYGVNDLELLNLSGGIPFNNLTDINFIMVSISNAVIATFLLCHEFKTQRTIFFGDSLVVNDYMRVKMQGRGIGCYLFVNQVVQARQLGFLELKVHAAGGLGWESENEDEKWDGYYFWAKMGYILDDDYQVKFDNWKNENGINVTNLNELVKNKNHLQTWKDKGFDWWGTFDLRNGSRSMIYLDQYLAKRSIVVQL